MVNRAYLFNLYALANEEPPHKSQKYQQYITTAVVNISLLAGGLALGWPSPVIEKLKDAKQTQLDKIITSNEDMWIGSLIALGAIIGPLPVCIWADKLGRKHSLIIVMIPFIVGWLIILLGFNIEQIYVARFMMGVSVGGTFHLVPVYVGEISEDSIRGSLGSFVQLFLSIGYLIAYAVGPYLSFFWFNFIGFMTPVLFVCLFMTYPESPYYLVEINKKDEAEKVLEFLRGIKGLPIKGEIILIEETIKESKNKITFKDIFYNRGNRNGLIISLTLVGAQQFTGINVVLFYTAQIFNMTGTYISSELSTIAIGVVQLVSSAAAPVVVERFGRKPLLLISATGMFFSLSLLGGYFYLADAGFKIKMFSFLPVTSLITYMISYCIGFGPLPWAAVGELFPPNFKSFAATANACFCWIVVFPWVRFFSDVIRLVGMSGVFWFCAIFCIMAGLFVLAFVPETRGKSLQEIQEILCGRPN